MICFTFSSMFEADGGSERQSSSTDSGPLDKRSNQNPLPLTELHHQMLFESFLTFPFHKFHFWQNLMQLLCSNNFNIVKIALMVTVCCKQIVIKFELTVRSTWNYYLITTSILLTFDPVSLLFAHSSMISETNWSIN